ncbi:MAG TPA: cytochrome c oxidase accessory protein CcoG [Candidatus Eisenbacteria bacterium]|nr:cytochrome c oxidase accessory protein CcoG [Candidatus Eisenbacteria bacterium]
MSAPESSGRAAVPPVAAGRVLSTLNEDGSRRRIRPRYSKGRFYARRRVVAYVLMLVFFAIPYLKMNGKPLILLDIPRREFTLFGTTFLSTETLLFMLLFLAILLSLFLATALFGRVWCGWACPQTVYMEYLFRPVEYWLEGGWRGAKKLDKTKAVRLPRVLKQGIYLGLSLFLAHTFLAYFVGVERLAQWVQRSPIEHPTSFLVMLGTTLMIFADFAWFREQTCLVACPYGRLQSVLLDRRSLIVGYDARRGEPRQKGMIDRPATAGDCIECKLCVLTCPTGIDIRDGLQMECIHCTQCIDACDAVMTRIGKPIGLIRYGSRQGFEGKRQSWLRPRVVLYPAALAIVLGTFAWALGTRADAEVTLLRGLGEPYTLQADGSVTNQIRVKVTNRGGGDHAYAIAIGGAEGATVIAPINPLPVPGGGTRSTSLFVVLPRSAFEDGERPVTVTLDDGRGFKTTLPYQLVGPEEEEEEEGEEGDENGRAKDAGAEAGAEKGGTP